MDIQFLGVIFIIFGLIEMIIGNLLLKFKIFKKFLSNTNDSFKNNIGKVTMLEGMGDVAVGSFGIIFNSFTLMIVLIILLWVSVYFLTRNLYK